jgi:hypothetical protein
MKFEINKTYIAKQNRNVKIGDKVIFLGFQDGNLTRRGNPRMGFFRMANNETFFGERLSVFSRK